MPTLRQYYQQVGKGLLESKGRFASFRSSVSFVPVEILEAYLQDLLTPKVIDEALFIKPAKRELLEFAWLPVSVIGVISLVLFSFKLVSPVLSGAFVGLTLASTTGAYVLFSLTQGMLRRTKFARMVHQEIVRRRGRNRPATVFPQAEAGFGRTAGFVH